MTSEDAEAARKAITELARTERLVTTILVILGLGGLIFTAVNVTLFAVDHHTHPGIAWMLDPLVSLALLGVLFIDGRLAAHGYKPNGWPFALRWFAGLATWLMNCWSSLYPDEHFTGWPANPDPAGLVLHSVIPLLVILLAEASARYREFCTEKKQHHIDTLQAHKDQQETQRRTEAEARRQREEADREAAEAERKRAADLAAEEKRTALETAKARELRAQSEAEARRAEQARLDAEARRRAEAEARERQAEIDRQNEAHRAELERLRILAESEAETKKQQAEAQAETERMRAEADLKAAEQLREDRKRAKEARRAATAIPATGATALSSSGVAETTALPQGATAIPAPEATAETRKLTAIPAAVPTAEPGDVRGAEAKRKQIEDANFEAAVLLLMDIAPTRKDFAAQYGRGETWGRDRYSDAERLMAEDPDFADRVTLEADSRNSILTSAS
ncbi:hypothetical protein ACWGOK_41435 [Streptomyces eurythermus]